MGVPPWILLGAVLILAPIFMFWASENIRRQKESTTALLLEKGAALIRSFEAGTRTGMMGMMGMRGTAFKLQRLLTETARQPDILYLMVTDDQGTVQAHSDPERLGETYGKDLDLDAVIRSEEPTWRRVLGPDGQSVFEVIKEFTPEIVVPTHRRHRMHAHPENRDRFMGLLKESPKPRVIFVGLDMSPFEKAQREETRHTVVMAVILLLIGFAGLFTVFLASSYRSTRRSLRRVQAFSDQVIENMPIGLVAVERGGTLAAFNRAAGRVLGISETEALGRRAEEALPRELSGLFDDNRSMDATFDQELNCTLGDGRHVPLDISLSTLRDQGGEITGALLLFRDVSEIRELKKEIERSRRLASVGRLAAGVAHEIRNPLSSIKGFATYFRERYRDVEEDRRTADIMIQEVDRLNRVIGQLLDFARPMAVEKRPVALDTLIRHAVKMVEGRAREQGVSIETHLSPDLVEVSLDLDRMAQVLLNLFLNALEAMPQGGTLRVDGAPDRERNRALIKVSDTGTGIAPEDLAHIFDPYFTTKSTGTGLGLAIVHKIVESHGGEISVESASGQGTTVSLHVPL